MAFTAISHHGSLRPSATLQQQNLVFPNIIPTTIEMNRNQRQMRARSGGGQSKKTGVKCNISLEDFIGGDLVKFDLGQWLSDVEEHKALAIYSPHEGGYEGRYLTRLRYQGYHFLDLTARGIGDPETTLPKFHPVCHAHDWQLERTIIPLENLAKGNSKPYDWQAYRRVLASQINSVKENHAQKEPLDNRVWGNALSR